MNAAGSESGLSMLGLSNRSPHPPASNGVRGRTDFSLAKKKRCPDTCNVKTPHSKLGGFQLQIPVPYRFLDRREALRDEVGFQELFDERLCRFSVRRVFGDHDRVQDRRSFDDLSPVDRERDGVVEVFISRVALAHLWWKLRVLRAVRGGTAQVRKAVLAVFLQSSDFVFHSGVSLRFW